MVYRRLDFTRKRVFSLLNTAYPSSFIRYQLIRRIHQLDTTYQPFHSEQRIGLSRAEQNLVEPSIESNVKFELGEELLKELHSNSYSGKVEEDVGRKKMVDERGRWKNQHLRRIGE
ncbi:hypothetical protein Tco_0970174 [Tanacetum coccineum]